MAFGAIFAGCSSSTYPPPVFEKQVDVATPGVLYEGDFTVPYNGKFAPFKLEFGQPHTQYELVLRIADTVPGRLEREQKEASEAIRTKGFMDFSHITLWKVIGSWGDDDYFGKLTSKQQKTHVRHMEYPGAPIQLRITLTPHAGINKPIEYVTAIDYGTGRRGHLASGAPLVITLDLSTFAQIGNTGNRSPQDKLLVTLPRLELLGSYHLRVDNLKPIDLPSGIEISLIQRQARITK